MFPILQIGPLALPAPGMFLLIGIWTGLTISERLAPRFKANPNHLYNLVFVTLISGVLGARFSFILQNLQAFLENPLNMFSLNPALLDPVGGIAVGLVAALIYGNRKQISWLPTLDAITPLLSIMLIALGLANLASGNAFGSETNLLWGINLWGATRHPTQIYQSIAGSIILVIIWPRKSVTELVPRVPGETWWLFLALISAAWMIIETFRGDSVVLPGGVRTTQIIAWSILAVSLWGLGKIKSQSDGAVTSV